MNDDKKRRKQSIINSLKETFIFLLLQITICSEGSEQDEKKLLVGDDRWCHMRKDSMSRLILTVFGMFNISEYPISRQVEEEDTVCRKFFKTGSQKNEELTEGWSVQQILMRIFPLVSGWRWCPLPILINKCPARTSWRWIIHLAHHLILWFSLQHLQHSEHV